MTVVDFALALRDKLDSINAECFNQFVLRVGELSHLVSLHKFIESKQVESRSTWTNEEKVKVRFQNLRYFQLTIFLSLFLRNLSRSCCSRSNWRQKATLRHLGQHSKCCKQDGKYWKSWLYAGLYCFLVERCKR